MKSLSTEELLVMRHLETQKHGNAMMTNKMLFLETIQQARNEGMTYSDIAETLNISPSRVQQLVRQADGRGRSNRAKK